MQGAYGCEQDKNAQHDRTEVQERIALLRGLDPIGRDVSATLRQIEPPAPAPTSARPAGEIPQASGWPLAGNALGMARDLRRFLTLQYRRLGPIFRIRAFNRRYIAMVGAEANRFMAGVGNNHFRSHETWADFNMATGAVHTMTGMDGAEHLRLRKLQAHAYSPQLIEGRLGEVIEITRREVAAWPERKGIAGQYAMQRIIAEQIGLLAAGMPPVPTLMI